MFAHDATLDNPPSLHDLASSYLIGNVLRKDVDSAHDFLIANGQGCAQGFAQFRR